MLATIFIVLFCGAIGAYIRHEARESRRPWLATAALAAVFIITKGPSPAARAEFVRRTADSGLAFVTKLFVPGDEIEAILAGDEAEQTPAGDEDAAPSESETPDESAAPETSEAPAESAEPETSEAPAESAEPSENAGETSGEGE